MIQFENQEVMGLEHAIRGMRNPMNSWDKSDSLFLSSGDYYDIVGNAGPWNGSGSEIYDDESIKIGSNDYELMLKLAKGGSVHAKYRRMITVYVDITAPLYWWKEFDTYKVGTVANSCSTMHKIHEKEFALEDFSISYIYDTSLMPCWNEAFKDGALFTSLDLMELTVNHLNYWREQYLETKDKTYWWQMIQLLPSSYNQKRTIMMNYEVLSNIYRHRKDHKLDEWWEFCKWIEQMPYSDIITCNAE